MDYSKSNNLIKSNIPKKVFIARGRFRGRGVSRSRSSRPSRGFPGRGSRLRASPVRGSRFNRPAFRSSTHIRRRNDLYSKYIRSSMLSSAKRFNKMPVQKRKTKIWDLAVLIIKSMISILALLYSLKFFGYVGAVPISVSHIVKGNNGTSYVYYITSDVHNFGVGEEYNYEYMDYRGNLTHKLNIVISDAYFTFDEVTVGFCGSTHVHTAASCACWALGYDTPEPVTPIGNCLLGHQITGYGRQTQCFVDSMPAQYKIDYCLHSDPDVMVSKVTGVSRKVTYAISNESGYVSAGFWDTRSMNVININGFTVTFVATIDIGSIDNLLGKYIVRVPTKSDVVYKVMSEMPLLGKGPGLCAASIDAQGNTLIDLEYFSNHSNAGLFGPSWCNPFVKFSVEPVSTYIDRLEPLSTYLPLTTKTLPTGLASFHVDHDVTTRHYNELYLNFFGWGASSACHLRRFGDQWYLEDKWFLAASSYIAQFKIYNNATDYISVKFMTDHCLVSKTCLYNSGSNVNSCTGGTDINWNLVNYFDCMGGDGLPTRVYCTGDVLFQIPLNYSSGVIIPIEGAKLLLTISGSQTIQVVEDGCKPETIVIKSDQNYYYITVTGSCSRYTVTSTNSNFPVGVLYNGAVKTLPIVKHLGTFNVTFTVCTTTDCSSTYHVFSTGDIELNRYVYVKYISALKLFGLTKDNMVGNKWWQKYFTGSLHYYLMSLGMSIASAFLTIMIIYSITSLLYYFIRVYYINKNFKSMDIWVTIILFIIDLALMYPIMTFIVYVFNYLLCNRLARLSSSKRRKISVHY